MDTLVMALLSIQNIYCLVLAMQNRRILFPLAYLEPWLNLTGVPYLCVRGDLGAGSACQDSRDLLDRCLTQPSRFWLVAIKRAGHVNTVACVVGRHSQCWALSLLGSASCIPATHASANPAVPARPRASSG